MSGHSERVRAHNLRYKFNLTIDGRNRIIAEQGGGCAICGKTDKEELLSRKQPLAVDHDHTLKLVRGVLCSHCNIRLSILEDEEFIAKAKHYLTGKI